MWEGGNILIYIQVDNLWSICFIPCILIPIKYKSAIDDEVQLIISQIFKKSTIKDTKEMYMMYSVNGVNSNVRRGQHL